MRPLRIGDYISIGEMGRRATDAVDADTVRQHLASECECGQVMESGLPNMCNALSPTWDAVIDALVPPASTTLVRQILDEHPALLHEDQGSGGSAAEIARMALQEWLYGQAERRWCLILYEAGRWPGQPPAEAADIIRDTGA